MEKQQIDQASEELRVQKEKMFAKRENTLLNVFTRDP
jgi:hypothetical protein